MLSIIRMEPAKYFWYQFIKKAGPDCSLGFKVQYELILIIYDQIQIIANAYPLFVQVQPQVYDLAFF